MAKKIRLKVVHWTTKESVSKGRGSRPAEPPPDRVPGQAGTTGKPTRAKGQIQQSGTVRPNF